MLASRPAAVFKVGPVTDGGWRTSYIQTLTGGFAKPFLRPCFDVRPCDSQLHADIAMI